MLGVSQAATVGINFPVNYSCCTGNYVNYVNAPAFGLPQSGWESVTPTGTGYSMPGCPLYIENTNVITTSLTAPPDAFFGQFLNPLPNGSLTVRWGCPTANWSGFGGYDAGHAAQPAPTNAPPRGEAEVYAGFFRDGINFGPINAGCGGPNPDNNQPGWYVEITGLKTLFTNTPFVVELIAGSDSMNTLTNAFIADATLSSTQSVTYPSPAHAGGDQGAAPWKRFIGGGISTVSTTLNTDHLIITPNRPQHGGLKSNNTDYDNASTLSGFVITDKPVVTMSPQSLLASGGQSITLNPYSIGVTPLSYQWRKGGVAIPNATSAALNIPSAALSDAGTYDLVVTNLYGRATSAVSTVTMDSITVTPGSDFVVDSNPAGSEHDGHNSGATWLASSADSTPITRFGVMQFSSATSNQITVPAASVFNVQTGALSFWFRSSAAPASPAIVFDRRDGVQGSEGSGLVILQTIGGNLEFQVGDGTADDTTTTISVSDNKWHHIAYNFEQGGGVATIFIDGVQDATQTSANSWGWPSTREIELGLSHDPAWLPFNGILDDFRLYSRKLTGGEIASIHTSDAIVDSSALVLRLNFDAAPQNGLSISWLISGAVLQSADSVSGPYTDVVGATSPYGAAAQAQKKFYRYRNPTASVVSNPFMM